MSPVHSNGIPAASYAALVDVDPPLVDHVLEILRDAGIGGYAEPIAGETGPYREVRAPDRPTSRVYVDRGQLATARDVIGQRLPALRADFLADAAARADAASMAQASADDVDAAWEQIVSGFDATAPDPEIPSIPAGEVDAPDSPQGGSGLSARLVRQHSPGPRDYEVTDDPDDERFVPPPPPPLPRPRDRFDTMAWVGTIGGPVLVVVSYVTGWGGWLAGAGFAAFTAGFITLIVRAGEKHRDDGDHGAVV